MTIKKFLKLFESEQVSEKAPPGAKAERMVKHIKKGYAKDGKLSDKEKSIAFATAWKAHNAGKLDEGINFVEMMRETEQTLEEMINELHAEIDEYKMTGHMGDKLRDAMELHRHNKNKLMGEANVVYEDDVLHDIAKLAGLSEDGPGAAALYGKDKSVADKMQSGTDAVKDFFTKGAEAYKDQYMTGLGMPPDKYTPADPNKPFGLRKSEVKEQDLAECGDISMDTEDNFNVSTNMSSDGTKNVTISAQGDKAEALMQMLKLAGLGETDRPAMVMVSGGDDEIMDEAEKTRITKYSNTPDEEYETVAAITRQGNDLNREKRQYADKPKLGDNPMAESVLDADLDAMLESILIREEQMASNPETGRVRMTFPPPSKPKIPDQSELPLPPESPESRVTGPRELKVFGEPTGTEKYDDDAEVYEEGVWDTISNTIGDIVGTEGSALRRSEQLRQLDTMRKQYKGTEWEPQVQDRYQKHLSRIQADKGDIVDYDPKTGRETLRPVVPPEQWKGGK